MSNKVCYKKYLFRAKSDNYGTCPTLKISEKKNRSTRVLVRKYNNLGIEQLRYIPCGEAHDQINQLAIENETICFVRHFSIPFDFVYKSATIDQN